MLHFISAYCSAKDGATAIEYSLIAVGISLAIVGVLLLFGDSLAVLYDTMLPAAASINERIVTGP